MLNNEILNSDNMLEIEFQEVFPSYGTTNYEELENKPSINGIMLEGDKTTQDLNIEIPDVSNFVTKDVDDLANYYNATTIDEKLQNKADASDIPDVSSFITKDADNLTNYELKADTGHSISTSIDHTTYVMTVALKNSAGEVLSTGTVDLPLETMVLDMDYDITTKELIIYLENGNEKRVDISSLVSGLVKTGEVYTKEETYSKTEIDDKGYLVSEADPTVPSHVKNITEENITSWNNKVDNTVNDLANYYNKENSYSNIEVDELLKNAGGGFKDLPMDADGKVDFSTLETGAYASDKNSGVVYIKSISKNDVWFSKPFYIYVYRISGANEGVIFGNNKLYFVTSENNQNVVLFAQNTFSGVTKFYDSHIVRKDIIPESVNFIPKQSGIFTPSNYDYLYYKDGKSSEGRIFMNNNDILYARQGVYLDENYTNLVAPYILLSASSRKIYFGCSYLQGNVYPCAPIELDIPATEEERYTILTSKNYSDYGYTKEEIDAKIATAIGTALEASY